MPNYKGHLFGGMVGFGLVIFFCSLHLAPCASLIEWGVCVLGGSLFPDIDTKSKGQKLLYLGISAVLIYCVIYRKFKTAVAIACIAMLPLLSKHRGIFHHFWCILIVLTALVLYGSVLYPALRMRITVDASFFMLGVVSHLYLDVGLKRMLRIS
jgi:hypothetical protein